jgi:hypothetical protein
MQRRVPRRIRAERLAPRGAGGDQRAGGVAVGQAGHRARVAAGVERAHQRDQRRLALADRREVPAGGQRRGRLGGGVDPAGDVDHAGAVADRRAGPGQVVAHPDEVGRVEAPRDDHRRAVGGDRPRQVVRISDERDRRRGGGGVGGERPGHDVEPDDARAHRVGDDPRGHGTRAQIARSGNAGRPGL